jgi:hypothetical protein
VRFLALLIFACPLAFGFADVKPQVEKDGIAHFDAHALEAVVCHNGEIHPGAFPMSFRGEKDMVNVQGTLQVGSPEGPLVRVLGPLATANTTAPLISITGTERMVEIPVTLTMPKDAIHLEIIIPPNAVVVHAENTTDTLAKPLQKFEQGLETVGARTELYLIYGAIAFVVLAAFGIWALFHLKRHVVQEVAKAGQA